VDSSLRSAAMKIGEPAIAKTELGAAAALHSASRIFIDSGEPEAHEISAQNDSFRIFAPREEVPTYGYSWTGPSRGHRSPFGLLTLMSRTRLTEES